MPTIYEPNYRLVICKNCGNDFVTSKNSDLCSGACRFFSFVDTKNDTDENCWLWNGCRRSSGYGRFIIYGKEICASRFAFEFFNGSIKEKDKYVCHTCDNPSCVGPDHLWLGTNSENQLDSVKKERHRFSKYKKERLKNGMATRDP